MPTQCPACKAEVPPGFKFCGHCGTAMAAAPPSGASFPSVRTGEVDAAQRRQLTVVFCDLAESTRLAERLDLEDLRDIVRAYQGAACAVIERFGGTVAQYLGDGILAYFGYPEAREDDARRAVRAALEVARSVELLSGQIDPRFEVTLAVRVAAHTGMVVTGDVGGGEHREELALGPTPNIAARLQEVAAKGTVAIGDTTHRLVAGFFECELLGERVLKGRPDPMPVYRVVRETSAKTLFDVAVARGLSAAVGRTEELELLDDAFARTAAGNGCAVMIRGEAGIGKSRLVRLFRERRGGSAAWVTFKCSSDDRASALRPVLYVTERAFGFAPGDSADIKLRKLVAGVAAYGNLPADAVPLLAAILGVPTGDAFAPIHLSPALQRSKTQEILLSLVLDSNVKRPVVLVVEDAHWADPSTLELLAMAAGRLATRRVLLLSTARPEFVAPWTEQPGVKVLGVGRLGRREVEALMKSVAGGKVLPVEVIRQVTRRTDGVPLFVEEMTKLVLESGMLEFVDGRYELREPLGVLAIPVTLHDSLLARLDRIGPAKAVAQLASVIGREFSLAMLKSVSPLAEAEFDAQLGQLVDAGLLDPPEATGGDRYLFRHALTQDAAYQSLLKNTRRRYHLAIAETFAERFPEMREAQPEVFAVHYAAAGVGDRAVACWTQAAVRAARLGSATESVGHCRSALEMIPQQPDGPDRSRTELMLQMILGDSLSVLQSYASPDVAAAYQRAAQLASDVNEESSQRFEVVCGLHRFHYQRGDFAAAFACATELMDRARTKGPLERVIASYMMGWVKWSRAEYTSVLPTIEAGLAEDVAAWGAPAEARLPVGVGSLTQGVQVRCMTRIVPALVLTQLGELDRSLALATEAVELARTAQQPYSEAFARYGRAIVHYFRGDAVNVVADGRRAVEISREHGYYFAALGAMELGWGLANVNTGTGANWSDEAIQMFERGFAAYRGAGARAGQTRYFAMLAEAYRCRGDAVRAAALLDEADVAADATGECQWLPEIHRQRAALARAAGDLAATKTQLESARDVARTQGNRLLELWAERDMATLS